MVVGEPQILGQVKTAYTVARSQQATGIILNNLLEQAFHVAKRVRTETGIATAAVSISSVAVELARKIFGDLEGRTVLILGAGESGAVSKPGQRGPGGRPLCVRRGRRDAARFP
ncbi:MAG: hemA, partial [candidate division NC10 bacterium]|nr:hemA [candidate division NC10 bacterium]